MAHYPKPFFRAPRGRWYVQINGKQINLGPDKDAAFKAYHGLMQRAETPAAVPKAPGAGHLPLVQGPARILLQDH